MIDSKKRYFINNYLKSKFAIEKAYGEPKCIFCGNTKILDLHHVYFYKKEKGGWMYLKEGVDKVIFVCPTHHYVFHRLIDNWSAFPDYYHKNYPKFLHNIILLKKRIIFLDYKQTPCYLKGVIKPYFMPLRAERMRKRYGTKYFNKERNKKGGVITFDSNHGTKNGLSELKSWFKEEDINKTPRCLICKNKLILDAHHVYKDKRIIFLCPNHHYMIHRHLSDKDGDNLTLKEIKKGIKNIEKGTKPYFQEVSEEEYQKYKGYNAMKIKE